MLIIDVSDVMEVGKIEDIEIKISRKSFLYFLHSKLIK